tara:strand:+ start:48 stop:602 length:555 start_codon:yes stop_codon:yes gene_type:complete
MKKIILSLFVLIGMLAYSQNLCEECVEQNGFYCGDDPTNWTQYSPNGCVPNGLNNLFYLNDGWEDCVDGSDESEAVPTTLEACSPYVEPCDTVYVDIPVIEYVYITDTITVVEYETIFDTIVEYVPEYIVEYIDCVTNEPCGNSQIIEIMKGSFGSDIIYNLNGQVIRKPEGIYIQNGEVKYKL